MTTENVKLHDLEVDEYLANSVTINDFAIDDEFIRVAPAKPNKETP